MSQRMLDFYACSGAMTSPGKYAGKMKQFPEDVGALMRIVQGLIVHEFVMTSFYGVQITPERETESHIRPVEEMIERIFALDSRPLTIARPPERRLVGVCRHFMVLLLALLRAKNIPARGRCGFGAYFNRGYFEDHVVCEYWNSSQGRWILADPQFDDIWRERLCIRHNVLDVPRDQFLIAGDAWARWRAGHVDPQRFRIIKENLRGTWLLATNLIHEAACLNKVEPLRWDVWGATPRPNQSSSQNEIAYFDGLAAITTDADQSFDSVRALYGGDERVKIPGTVFNSLRNRTESVTDKVMMADLRILSLRQSHRVRSPMRCASWACSPIPRDFRRARPCSIFAG